MCMESRRFSQAMASEWQTAFVVSHKMPWCALLTAVKNYNKSLEKLQDFFFKTETKTKYSRPRLHDPRPRPRLSFLSSRRLKTKTLVSRTASLHNYTFAIRLAQRVTLKWLWQTTWISTAPITMDYSPNVIIFLSLSNFFVCARTTAVTLTCFTTWRLKCLYIVTLLQNYTF